MSYLELYLGCLWLNNENAAILKFFNSVFTDRLSPISASGSFSGSILTGSGVNFTTSNVKVGDYVYASIPQSSEGVFAVVQVIDDSHLQVDGSPVAGPVNFRVAQAFGVVGKTLTDIFSQQQQVRAFYGLTTPWLSLISTQIKV